VRGGTGGESISGSGDSLVAQAGGATGGGSYFRVGATTANSEKFNSDSSSISRTEAYRLSFLFFLATLPFVGAALWAFINAAREKEQAERESDAPYQNLETEQILGKIIKRS